VDVYSLDYCKQIQKENERNKTNQNETKSNQTKTYKPNLEFLEIKEE
jgi:hypothetical protein